MLTAPSKPQKEVADESMAPSEPQQELEEELRKSTEQEILALPIPKCKSQQNTDGLDKIKDMDGRNIRKAFNKVRMEVWINETLHLEFWLNWVIVFCIDKQMGHYELISAYFLEN